MPAGVLDPSSDEVRANHLCYVYSDPGEFRARAIAFLKEGLAAGQRMEYTGGGSVEGLREDLRHVAEFDDPLDRGDLLVRSLDARYGEGSAVDPVRQVATYMAATRAALADGYTGLRVTVDAAALVRTAQQREAFARYEHLMDRYMVDEPLFAMCAYDGWELGGAATTEMACLHPVVSDGSTRFRWWAVSDTCVGLAGEIDMADREAFDVTLARTMPLLAGPRLVVDARGLDFIDHRGLLLLERHARRTARHIVLRTDTPIVHRLTSLLGLRAVEVA